MGEKTRERESEIFLAVPGRRGGGVGRASTPARALAADSTPGVDRPV